MALAPGDRSLPVGHGAPVICCAIATHRMAQTLAAGSKLRASRKSAPRSPWQNAYVERVIGSIRRECLDHIVIFNERHLPHVLSSYVDYYQRTRTHLSLDKDCPDPCPIMPRPIGKVSPSLRSVACVIATNASPPDSFRIPAHQLLRGGRKPSSENLYARGFLISIRRRPLVVQIASASHLNALIRWQFSRPLEFRFSGIFSSDSPPFSNLTV